MNLPKNKSCWSVKYGSSNVTHINEYWLREKVVVYNQLVIASKRLIDSGLIDVFRYKLPEHLASSDLEFGAVLWQVDTEYEYLLKLASRLLGEIGAHT
jgi:hypothetical protein